MHFFYRKIKFSMPKSAKNRNSVGFKEDIFGMSDSLAWKSNVSYEQLTALRVIF